MVFKFEKKSVLALAGYHLTTLQHFKIPYEIALEGEFIIFTLSEDLPPKLIYDFGRCVMMLEMETDRLFQELQWPIKESI